MYNASASLKKKLMMKQYLYDIKIQAFHNNDVDNGHYSHILVFTVLTELIMIKEKIEVPDVLKLK